MGKEINLSDPKTFCEKQNWLKLYDRKPIYTVMVDKYLAIYENLKESSCTEFCKDVVGEFLDQSVVDAMEEIVSCAKSMVNENVTIMFDPTLVRGMGYYTGPIFEITIDGYGFSIAGGGRYDKMIGKFSGQDVCASGFSIGFERIITILKDKFEDEMKISDNNLAILIEKGVSTEKKMELFAKAKELRSEFDVGMYERPKKLGKLLGRLENEGYWGALINPTEEIKVFEKFMLHFSNKGANIICA